MANTEEKTPAATTTAALDDDEPDEWDKRIFSTGCAAPATGGGSQRIELVLTRAAGPVDENARMTDCYYEKKDWRACTAEMEQFKQCWKRHGNDERTASKDT